MAVHSKSHSFDHFKIMDNNELEKYLNSLILCQHYYYYELMHLVLSRFDNEIRSHFRSDFIINEACIYHYKNHFPDETSNVFLLVKKHFTRAANDTYSYHIGMTKCTYSREEGIDYFITHLKKTLDEYLLKNHFESVKISFIYTDTIWTDGLGSLLIHTPTETFLIQAYDMDDCGRD